MTYELPKSVSICGKSLDIRSDFRAVLDIIAALNDPELSEQEKLAAALEIFFVHPEDIPHDGGQDAANAVMWFIAGGTEDTGCKTARKVMDWEQDFAYIVAPVNRVLGYEIRERDYLHWWTFLSAYYEIGECVFSNIVSLRVKKSKGKKLENWEKDFYRENKSMIDLKERVSSAQLEKEQDIIEKIFAQNQKIK